MKSSKGPAGRSVLPLRLARTALPAVALSLAAGLSAAPPSRSTEKTVVLAAGGTVVVDTYKGTVKVAPWDRSEVKVSARIEADGDCREAAELVEKTRVEITSRASEVRIRSNYDALPKWGFFSSGSECSSRPLVHYVLSVPRDAALTLKDYKSDSVLEGVGGTLDLETYKGTIRASGGAGLRVETYKGDVAVALSGLPKGASAETYKGRIEISVPKGTAFTLRGDTHRGDIDLAGIAAADPGDAASSTAKGPHARAHGHDETLHRLVNGGGAEVKVSTYKGTIRVTERPSQPAKSTK